MSLRIRDVGYNILNTSIRDDGSYCPDSMDGLST